MPVPDFSPGEVLTAAAMDSIGMWKVASGTLNASATNFVGCFTSAYRNYRIVFTEMNSAAGFFGYRMLQGATANATAYNFYLSGGANTAGFLANAGNSQSYGSLGFIFSPVTGGCASGSYDIMCPQISTTRTWLTGGYDTFNFGTSINFYTGGSVHDVSAAYDGIQILTTAAGNLTGNVRIYGYRD
jgi:hypothetical protein